MSYEHLPQSEEHAGVVDRQRCKGRLHFTSGLLLGLALATLLVAFGVLLVSSRPHREGIRASSAEVAVLFAGHPEYESLSHEQDSVWNDMIPLGGGMKAEEVDGDRILVGLTMFHELHCLKLVRNLLQRVVVDNFTFDPFESYSAIPEDTDPETAFGPAHVLHCINYLRQAILCQADDSIEYPARGRDGGFTDAIDGSGVRQCRDTALCIVKLRVEQHLCWKETAITQARAPS